MCVLLKLILQSRFLTEIKEIPTDHKSVKVVIFLTM